MTAQFGDFRVEDQLIIRRVAGALARENDVTVLFAGAGEESQTSDGAVEVRRFSEPKGIRLKYAPLIEAAFGRTGDWWPHCECISESVKKLAENLSVFVMEEIARAAGGDSQDLYSHLNHAAYDVVIFAGYKFASTRFGMEFVPQSARIILLPLAINEPVFWMPTYDSVFARAERIIVTTDTEKELVRNRTGKAAADRLRNVRFFLDVNRLSAETDPVGGSNGSFFLIGAEILDEATAEWTRGVAAALKSLKDSKIVVISPRLRRPDVPWLEWKPLVSRADYWRWVSRAVAFIDPRPQRLLGRDALEAYLYGTPILVSAAGAANLEHADAGNGGLWFSGTSDIETCLELMHDHELRDKLGAQGEDYALRVYGDPDGFTRRVLESVIGERG